MSAGQWLWLFFVQTVWAGSYIGMKVAGREMPVSAVVFLRYGTVALCFVAYWLVRGFPKFSRRDFFLLVILGVANFALAPILQVMSLTYTQAIDASIMIAFEPFITIALASLIVREKPSRKTLVAMLVATVGMLILSDVTSIGISAVSRQRAFGNLIFLSSLVCEALVTANGRRLTERYSPSSLMGMMMCAGFVAGTLFNAPTINRTNYSTLSASAWASVFYLSLGCSVFAYVAWYRMIRSVPVHRVALSLFVQPVAGSLLGWSLLHEDLSAHTLAGALLICASLAWWQYRGSRKTTDALS